MTLISPKELNRAIIRNFGKGNVARAIISTIQSKKINKFYKRHQLDNSDKFVDAVISRLKLKYEINPEELKRIPTEGPIVIISNHPFGGIDGILLLKVLSKIRPDIKIIADNLLQRVEPIKDYFFPISAGDVSRVKKLNLSSIKQAINHVQNNNLLVVFPAGEVATFNTETRTLNESEWQYSLLKFIKKLKTPVVPLYFQQTGQYPANFFNFIGAKSPDLPDELFNLRKRNIRIRIGNPISIKDQNLFSDINQYGRYLRVKTNSLGSPIEVKKFFRPQFQKLTVPEKIVDPIAKELLIKDVENLPKHFFLFKTNNFSVYCAPSYYLPNVLNEIGRLREITFREVGEGTDKSIDLDEFDLYYHHLFIWDSEKSQICGAYRVGKGKDIIQQYGKRGFYIHSLFRIDKQMMSILSQSLELGRSFIYKEYQQKPLPLFMLWKGILYFLLKHKEYRYLIGPVSISNQFSSMSKALITEFIKSNNYDYNLAQYIRPRTQFKAMLHDIDTDIINQATNNDISKLDKFIEDIEPMNFKLPVLLKKYIKLNAKIIGFNIDPKFNDALDGLILLDLLKVPLETVQSLSKELDDTDILERFYQEK